MQFEKFPLFTVGATLAVARTVRTYGFAGTHVETQYLPPGDREGRPYGKNDTEPGERVTKPAAPGTKLPRGIPAAVSRRNRSVK